MRDIWIRSSLGLVWVAAAVVSGGALYVVMGIVFLVSAYSGWRKERNGKGDE